MAIVRKEYPVSLDYILEELSRGSSKLRPVFQKMLSLYRSGRYDEAFEYFEESVNSKYSGIFVSLLSKIDKINPYELASQLDIYIDAVREARVTAQMKQAERRSLIITAFAASAVLAGLVNFCVVVVFLDTLSGLRYIF